MASPEEYARWIVQNQDKKGSPEFETVSRAYQTAKDPNAKYRALYKPEAVDPAEGMSGVEKFAAGMGKSIYDTGRGINQLVSFGDRAKRLRQEETDIRERDRPLMDTGAGVAGDITGQVIQTLLPGGALKAAGGLAKAPALAAAGDSLLAPKSMSGAFGLGAGYGGLQPTENMGETVTNMGVGGVATAAVPGLINAGRATKAALQPMYESGQRQIIGNALRGAAGPEADTAARAMTGATELVPGSQPSAAQVSQSGGIAALERAAAQANPEMYAKRQLEQNAARISSLRSIAGDESSRQMQRGVREMMTSTPYADAMETGINKQMADALRPQIDNLMSRPSMQSVVDRAKRVFGEETISLAKSGDIRGLQMVKQALDDVIEGASGPASSMGKNELRALQQTRSDLLSTMQDIAPKLREADALYKTWSKPVNQMDIAAKLADKLEPALTQGNLPIRMNAEQYARALREGDTLAQKVTGSKASTLEGVMEPHQMDKLNAIKDDMARSAVAQNLGRGAGSNTFQNLAQANLMEKVGVTGLPQMLSRPVQATNYVLRSVYGAANRDMEKKLAEALLNPKDAAKMIAEATPSEKAMLIDAIVRRGATPLGMAAPGAINANQ